MRDFDIRRFNQSLVVLGTVAVLLVAIIKGNSLSNPYLAFGVPIAIAGMMLIGNLRFLWCFLIMMSASQIGAGDAQLYAVLSLAFAMAGLLVIMMHKGEDTPLRPQHRFMVGFMVVAILVASVRGLGLRILGSAMWGGAQYLTLWGGVGLFLFSQKLFIPRKYLVRAIVVMFVVGTMPGVLRLVNEISGGRLNPLGGFITGVALDVREGDSEGARLGGVQFSGLALVLLSMVMLSGKKKSVFQILTTFLVGFVILGYSGFRSAMIYALMYILFYYIQMRRIIPARLKNVLVTCGLVSVVALPFLLPHLPFGFQRMFAWIPGINISEFARKSAEGTSEWRIEMWKMMLPMIKDYWIIGRGLAYELSEAYNVYIGVSDIDRQLFFIAVHSYHSGPLFLLVDFGLAGFVCAAGFMYCTVAEHWKRSREQWADPVMKNLHAILLARCTTTSITFYIIFGALPSLMSILLDATLLGMLYKVNRHELAKQRSTLPAEVQPPEKKSFPAGANRI